MVYSAANLFAKPGAPLIFLRHRIARIAPLYWATTTIAIWQSHFPVTAKALLGSYFFVPFMNYQGDVAPIYGVGWTLNFEMFFYVLFAVCLLFPRRIGLAVLAVLLLVAVAFGRIIRPDTAPLIIWTDPIIAEFLFGAAVAVIYRRGVVIPKPLALLIF